MLTSPVNRPGPFRGDHEIAQARGADDLDLTSLHHEERHVGIAALDRKHLAARDSTDYATGGYSRYPRGAQRRKHERRIHGARERRGASVFGRHRFLARP